ncbi:MAG: hypothetical protein P8H59_00090 [Flavobacteriales bacterium]|nr:hypothetical protein [Flavobacteriales bacterium]MDG1779323.1 hypothetical protein [Flavobacteriales bacterium]MDG2246322.1 hypothetical protein [Flavobacteriales bacterium]
MKHLFLASLVALGVLFASSAIDGVTILPTRFENNLIYLSVPNSKGDTLLMYTDTGGKNLMYKGGFKKLKIRYKRENFWRYTGFDTLFPKYKIPLPESRKMYRSKGKHLADGMLGREWFRGKIWEFDYNVSQLRVLTDLDGTCRPLTDLYFLDDTYLRMTDKCGRFFMVVDGQTIPMLFDTGAQVKLSSEAQKQLTSASLIAGSFINASVFDAWAKGHPDWQLIKGGDVSVGTEDMIKVPEVRIGEVTIGPVWFAKRADYNFTIMSEMCMDNRVSGALGGNAFAQLGSVIADYPGGKLYVRR